MSDCTCYWIDPKYGTTGQPVRMLNPSCPVHGSVSSAPTQPVVVWPDIPRNRNARAS